MAFWNKHNFLTAQLFVILLLVGVFVPADANADTSKMRTVKVSKEKAAQGKALFGACMGCHGMNGEGRIGIGPALNSKTYLAAASDEMLYKTISEGRRGTNMAAWGKAFEPEQIDTLIAFIRTLNTVKAVALDESVALGNAANGQKLFSSVCSHCHGASGGGYNESGAGTGIGRMSYLNQVSNGFLRYIIKQGKSGTQMRSFSPRDITAVANFSDEEIEDIIVYMRANAW